MSSSNPSDSVNVGSSATTPISVDEEIYQLDQTKGAGGVQSVMNYDFMGSGSLSSYEYDNEAIKDVTAKMIMVHEYPFTMVEDELFILYCKTLNPKYVPFEPLAIRDHAMKLYMEEKTRMKAMFAIVGKVNLTYDLWTFNQTKDYMCITWHFVDADWKLQSRILNLCLLPPPHRGIAIADKIFECLSEWGIENKVSTVTLDNASSNDAVIQSLREQFQIREGLHFGGKIFHVRCCAHILNFLAQDGLTELKSTIENVRESVKHILLTPSHLQKWNEVVKAMSLPTNKMLVLDVVTQWNSTFHMLERALIFKEAFPRYASRDPSFMIMPSQDEWERASDVCKFLSAFDRVTEIFSGCKYTTANLYFPEIWKIRQILDAAAKDPRDFMKLMVAKMTEKFDKYWNECNLFMIVALVLDPRYKLHFIKFIFEKIYDDENVKDRLSCITNEMHVIYDEYVRKETSDESDDNLQDSMVGRTRDSFRAKFEMWLKTTSVAMPTRKELDVYFGEGILMGSGEDFDVLAWWKSSTWNFPILSKMARDILSIPVTTVPSDSTYSTERRVINDDLCSWGDDTVEGVVCASNWFRSEFQV